MNPNFPRLEHGWGAIWDAAGGSSPIDGFMPVTDRTQGTSGTQRGRQYETDQVQAGTLSVTVGNNDGALDPSNTSGPWYGHIMPYQPYRLRAQWPPTKNMFSPAVASTDGLPVGLADQSKAGAGVFGNGLSVVATTSPFTGSNVWQVSINSGTAAGLFSLFTYQAILTPGSTYTLSFRARVVTDGVSPQLNAAMSWRDGNRTAPTFGHVLGTTTTLTGSSTATGWTSFSVTGTVPAQTAQVVAGIALSAAAPATFLLQVDGLQVEEAAAATAYEDPGPWWPVFSGYVERWPQAWTQGYTYSVVQPTAVDAFALLSQRELRDVLTEEIYSNSPRFLYALDDPQDSGQAADATGNFPPAPINSSKYGHGSVVFGSTITATDPVNGIFAGSNTVCTVTNPNPGTDLLSASSYFDLKVAGITGPANPTGDWARMLAFRYTGPTPAAGSYSVLWSQVARDVPGAHMRILIDSSGTLFFEALGPSSSVNVSPSSENVVDGNWHLVIISYQGASRALTINMDGTGTGGIQGVGSLPTVIVSDTLGAFVDPTTGNASTWNFAGDLAFAAEFPSFLSDQSIFDIQAAWRDAFSGDSTDDRYKRILRFAGYQGRDDVHPGVTRSMGPAQLDGQDALTALAEVVDTEGGAHFVDKHGAVCFRPRSDRYNATDPVIIFGEDEAAGEVPYEDIQLDYDPTHLGNLAQVTQPSTGQVFTAQDALSQQRYFPRTISRTVNASDPLECQDAASYLVSRYKDPAQRITSLTVNPSSNPALWAACLGLELFTRARVIRRPLGRPPIVLDVFIENLSWAFTEDNSGKLTIQCSPADPTLYGSLAAWHSSLSAPSAVGATTITVRASADGTNPIAAQLPVGQQLVLGLGTANQETVAIKSLPVTSAGWTTAVVTLTAATTKSHATDDVVCEALPAGATDPTTWDVVSEFDNHAFVY